MKALDVSLSGLFLSYCPWTDTTSNARVIEGAETVFYAITYTLFVVFLYMFSKGWKVVDRKPFERCQWVLVGVLSVFTYATYNAWLYFANDDDFHATLVTLAITAMYIVFVALTTRNFINIRKRLNIAKLD